jgi:DNA-binding response OmpR family regulator
MPNNRVCDERRGSRDASPAPRLLLLDQDPWCRALADGALRAQGYRVVCSGDIDTAARVAREMSPDLVVVDVGVPVLEEVPVGQRRNTDRAQTEPFPTVSPGYCILRPLELEPSGALRPVVMLRQDAGGGDGGRTTRFAVLGYVAKPFTPYTLIRHLGSHVGRLRARAQAGRTPAQPTNGNAPPAAFEGSVEALGVPAVLEILHFNQLSGVCTFEAPGGRRAEVEFQSGEVIGARTADGANGADAIFRLVTWTDGRFVFNIRSFGEDVRTLLRFEQMMLEGMRRLDEGRTFPFEMMMGVATRIGSS